MNVRSPGEETLLEEVPSVDLVHLLVSGPSCLPLKLVVSQELEALLGDEVASHLLTEMLHHDFLATLLLFGGESGLDQVLTELTELVFDIVAVRSVTDKLRIGYRSTSDSYVDERVSKRSVKNCSIRSMAYFLISASKSSNSLKSVSLKRPS